MIAFSKLLNIAYDVRGYIYYILEKKSKEHLDPNIFKSMKSNIKNDLNNQLNIIIYILIFLIMAISIGQVIYRIKNNKKSAIIWILIGICIPPVLPTILKSDMLMMIRNSMFSGNFFLLFCSIIFIGFICAILYIAYKKLVSVLDTKNNHQN